MLSLFSAKAMAPRPRTPDAGISSTIGSTFAARGSALTASVRRPRGSRFVEIARVAESRPCRLLGGEREPGALRDEPALLLGQRRVEVQHERVGVGPKLGDDKRHPLGHEARHEGYVTREAVELGDHHRATRGPAANAAASWGRRSSASARATSTPPDGNVQPPCQSPP
jgi:hypothetical protein